MTVESDTPFSRRAVLFRGRGAVNAWLFAVYGMIPGLGVILGPIAALIGIWARLKHRTDSEYKGRALANAAIVVGSVLWITTWIGLGLIWQALTKS